jgi:hypothetical protein
MRPSTRSAIPHYGRHTLHPHALLCRYAWEWEGQTPPFVMAMLGELLEDHASPFQRTLEGLHYAAELMRIPEEEWDGEVASDGRDGGGDGGWCEGVA